MFHYTADPRNLRNMSERVFDAVRKRVIRPLIGARYLLAGAADAHRIEKSVGRV
jgi:NADPH:quinone reductase-like Zn-dependent oxidoreductase